MNSSIDMIFEQKCLDAVKREVLSLSSDKEERIFMFGSRAKGDYKRGSDIDIGFEGLDDEDYRKIKIHLGLFWEESFVPYHLDLVNFNHVRDEFRKVALEKIELWKSR